MSDSKSKTSVIMSISETASYRADPGVSAIWLRQQSMPYSSAVPHSRPASRSANAGPLPVTLTVSSSGAPGYIIPKISAMLVRK